VFFFILKVLHSHLCCFSYLQCDKVSCDGFDINSVTNYVVLILILTVLNCQFYCFNVSSVTHNSTGNDINSVTQSFVVGLILRVLHRQLCWF